MFIFFEDKRAEKIGNIQELAHLFIYLKKEKKNFNEKEKYLFFITIIFERDT